MIKYARIMTDLCNRSVIIKWNEGIDCAIDSKSCIEQKIGSERSSIQALQPFLTLCFTWSYWKQQLGDIINVFKAYSCSTAIFNTLFGNCPLRRLISADVLETGDDVIVRVDFTSASEV